MNATFPPAEAFDEALAAIMDANSAHVDERLAQPIFQLINAESPGAVSLEDIGRLAVFLADAIPFAVGVYQDLLKLRDCIEALGDLQRDGEVGSIPEYNESGTSRTGRAPGAAADGQTSPVLSLAMSLREEGS
jgi:hypothetical protein